MKRLLLAFSYFLFAGTVAQAQTFCNPNGNLILYTNYDGGILNINIDQNIPNIKIGVVTYESVQINITGAFASNVTDVVYAGFNGSNDNCSTGITVTSINSTGSTNTILFYPPGTISNPNGNANIICAYSCDISSNQGGCNTVDEIEAYWLNYFPGSTLRSHMVQYNCYPSTQLISNGGNCCGAPAPLSASITPVQPTCNGGCNGSAIAAGAGGTPSYTYQWTGGPATALWSGLCAGTYTVTVTDGASATTTQTVTLTNPPVLQTTINHVACQTYTWPSNGMTYTASATYLDTVAATNGCDSFLTLNLTIGTGLNLNVTQTTTMLTSAQAGATYQWLNCTGNVPVSGATAQSYSPPGSGTYAVIVTYQGCSDTSACYSLLPINVAHVATNTEFNIYPNPAHNEVYIESAITKGNYVITDQLGKVILKGSLTGNRTAVSLEALSSGLYFMSVDDTKPVKLVKQ
jgi:hypothetical protein